MDLKSYMLQLRIVYMVLGVLHVLMRFIAMHVNYRL